MQSTALGKSDLDHHFCVILITYFSLFNIWIVWRLIFRLPEGLLGLVLGHCLALGDEEHFEKNL